MLRDNIKKAILNSGMIVKDIAAKAEVNKRTIDKWVGASETEPKVKDLYKVCKVLGVSIEWVVDGEAGSEYIRKIIGNDPKAIQVPERISSLVDDLLVLDETQLIVIKASAAALAESKRGQIPKAG